MYGEGLLAFYQSEHENALTAFQESIRVFAEAEDEAGRAYTLMHLGILTEPFEDSRPLLEESVAIFRRSEDSWGLALATFYLGVVTVLKSSHPTDAIPILEESLTRFRQIGDSWGVSGALYYLGLVSERRDDTTAARGYYGEALTLFRSQRDKWRMGVVLLSLVQIDFAEQRFADVPERVREELGLSREIGNDRQLAQSLSVCAALVGVERDYHRMGVLWGAAQALAEAHGWPWQPEGTELAGFEETVATAMNEMGASVWQAVINEGRIMTTDRAIAYALEGIS